MGKSHAMIFTMLGQRKDRSPFLRNEVSSLEKNKIVLGEHRSILSFKEDQGVPAWSQDRKGQTQDTLPARDPDSQIQGLQWKI